MKKENGKLGTVILDNSPTQLTLLKKLVLQQPELELLGAFGNPLDAHQRIGEVRANLLILDVELPYMNGFNFIETLNEHTQIIFATASPDHALKAFDHGITDYLMKPVDPERFRKAIAKAVRNHTTVLKSPEQEKLVIRCDLQQREVNVAEILWVEAMGDYVKLVTPTERVVVLSTLKAMDKKLPDNRFLRIHRSYIVNLDRVDRFNSTSVDIGGKTLPMSRSHKPVLEQKLHALD